MSTGGCDYQSCTRGYLSAVSADLLNDVAERVLRIDETQRKALRSVCSISLEKQMFPWLIAYLAVRRTRLSAPAN